MLLSKLKILPLDPGEKSSLPPNIITWLQPQSYELKGSDRLCKVVELSMQYPEFERKFDVQNPYFGDGYVFRIGFFKLSNNGQSLLLTLCVMKNKMHQWRIFKFCLSRGF